MFSNININYPEVDMVEPISDGRMKLSNKDVIEIYQL